MKAKQNNNVENNARPRGQPAQREVNQVRLQDFSYEGVRWIPTPTLERSLIEKKKPVP